MLSNKHPGCEHPVDGIQMPSVLSEQEKQLIEQERKKELDRARTRGYVVDCDGEFATICATVMEGKADQENYWAVGQLISIKVGLNRVVGLCCKVDLRQASWTPDAENLIHISLELVGEIIAGTDGYADKFSTGIANYPQMGCIAHRIRSTDLEIIFKSEGDSVAKIGQLTQDKSVDAKIDIDKLLSRHFAIVGTTGVGKSTSVTLILRKIIKTRPDIRVLMLDPHNEFASAFPEESVVVDASNLVLPFWLFKLDEFSEVVFRGQSGFDAEIEILRDLIPLAKEQYKQEGNSKQGSLVKKVGKTNLTADMPVPYRLADLMKAIDDRLGLLERKAEKPILKSLQHKLESISSDPRFRFMFDQSAGGDIMESIVSQIFRVPQQGKPICVLEMSGLPSEVVNSVVSVLCRMSFELAMNSNGGIQTLVVCEEAHRYIPADEGAGFWPTRQSISRIAKEGRKYGVYLSIITQRPGELDPTILSQCNTVFAMRLGNQKDQDIISGAVTNGAKSTISFLSSIANRECIAFGEAIHTPMRMTFETIKAKDLPGAHIYEQQEKVKDGMQVSLAAVLRKMRQEDRKPLTDEAYAQSDPTARAQALREQASSSSPGKEINSILNAAYSGKNGSLTPDLGTSAPPLQPNQTRAGPATQMTRPQAQQQQAAPPQLSPPPAQQPAPVPRGGGGANSLIKSFRKG
jgi:DNA helicase HerA-like ATPase